MTKIQLAEKADLKKILALQYLAYQSEAKLVGDLKIPPLTQTPEGIIQDFEKGIMLKAVNNGKIIGSIRAYADRNTVYIGRLIVHPSHQGKGIGTQLLKAIEEKYPQYLRYELFTSNKSVRNIALYERLGYQKFKEEKLSDDLSMVYMEKQETNKAISNPALVSAIEAMYKGGTNETQKRTYECLLSARFLLPATISPEPKRTDKFGNVTLTQGTKIGLPKLKMSEKDHYYFIFSDWAELGKWQKTEGQQTLIVTFKEMCELLASTDNVDGLIINPYGQYVYYTKEDLQGLLPTME